MFTSTDLATGVQCHPSVQSHPARRYPKRTGLSPKWDPNRTWRNKKRTPNHKIPTRKVRKNSKYLPEKSISRKKIKNATRTEQIFSKSLPEQWKYGPKEDPNRSRSPENRTRKIGTSPCVICTKNPPRGVHNFFILHGEKAGFIYYAC